MSALVDNERRRNCDLARALSIWSECVENAGAGSYSLALFDRPETVSGVNVTPFAHTPKR